MSIVYELLLEKEKELLSKLEEVRNAMKPYIDTVLPSQIENIEFSKKPIDNLENLNKVKKYSVPQRILYALKENNRFMKIREIAKFISDITKEDEDYLVKQFSRRTKFLKEKNKIVKKQVGPSKINTFWGSPNWVDSENNIKKEYKYNSDNKSTEQTSLIDL